MAERCNAIPTPQHLLGNCAISVSAAIPASGRAYSHHTMRRRSQDRDAGWRLHSRQFQTVGLDHSKRAYGSTISSITTTVRYDVHNDFVHDADSA